MSAISIKPEDRKYHPDITEEEWKLIDKLLAHDPEGKLKDALYLDDFGVKRLMDLTDVDGKNILSEEDAKLIPTLTTDEYIQLAEVFRRQFPEYLNPICRTAALCSDLPIEELLQENPWTLFGAENKSLEAVNLIAGANGEIKEMNISQAVLETLENAFNRERETVFLLFANQETGIVDVVERMPDGNRMNFSLNARDIMRAQYPLEQRGYQLVGVYHSHTMTNEQAMKRDQDKGITRARPFQPDLLSGASGDVFYNDKNHQSDVVHLIGSNPTGQKFKVRAFLIEMSRLQRTYPEIVERLDPERFLTDTHYETGEGHDQYELDIVRTNSDSNIE